MTKKEIKAFIRERKLRPYKRGIREILMIIRSLGANVLIVMTALFGGWIVMVAMG